MRVTLKIDSATAQEAQDFVFAFQRTRHMGESITDQTGEPTVAMMGVGWHITLPPVQRERADAIMVDFAGTQTQ